MAHRGDSGCPGVAPGKGDARNEGVGVLSDYLYQVRFFPDSFLLRVFFLFFSLLFYSQNYPARNFSLQKSVGFLYLFSYQGETVK